MASIDTPAPPLGVWNPNDAMFAYAIVDPFTLSTAFPADVSDVTALYDASFGSAMTANPVSACTHEYRCVTTSELSCSTTSPGAFTVPKFALAHAARFWIS